MESSLTLTGKKDGIKVLLPEEKPWEQLLGELKDKLVDAKALFSEKTSAIDVGGRALEDAQKEELTKLIRLYVPFPCEISFNSGEEQEIEMQTPLTAKELEANTRWIRGTVRSGSKIISEGHLFVLGDVNPGAELSAKGNVVVFGVLKGMVQAGSAGNRDAYVAANILEPVQLRIADVISRSPDGEGGSSEIFPEIAFIEDDSIFIEPVLKKM